MVANVASFARSGLKDFVLQRVSAVVLALYALCVLGFFLVTAEMDRTALHDYFHSFGMRFFSTLAVAALAAHAWVGMWTIGTDYVRQHYFGRGHTVYLAIYQLVCLAVVFIYVVWPMSVIWGG